MTCALSFPAAHEPEETSTGWLLDALTDIVNVAELLADIAAEKTGIPGHFLARLLVCFAEEACDAVEVIESDQPAWRTRTAFPTSPTGQARAAPPILGDRSAAREPRGFVGNAPPVTELPRHRAGFSFGNSRFGAGCVKIRAEPFGCERLYGISSKGVTGSTMSETVERNELIPHRYTLGEAAKAVGRSKAALSRAISNGALSAEKQPDGSYQIDAAELFRVYRAVDSGQPAARVTDAAELNPENRELRAKLEAATQRLTELRHDLADLREDRDHWRAQAERLLLSKPPPEASEPPPATPARWRWWQFGRQSRP